MPDNSYEYLHLAAKEGHLAIVQFLVEKQFDKDARDKSENTPLLVAVDK